MALLVAFALVAGAGTAVSPCVLPVLPALLSASAAGGRRRPLGVVLGLTITFWVTIVGAAKVVGGVGLGDNGTRAIAVGVLGAFGLALAVPPLAHALEAPLARLSRLGPRTRGDGFASGLLVGGALGFAYAPCAGPLLAAVVTVGAASGRAVVVGLAYAAGSGLALLALGLGGRRLVGRLSRGGRAGALRQAMGAVMLATAVALAANLDVQLESALARHAPTASLTAGLERSHAVTSRLDALRPPSRFAAPAAGRGAGLPDLGEAPDFTGTQRWFNSAPLTLAGLRGRVVLVDFWTYTCINCLRTLPYLEAWDRRYRGAGLTIVGVHSPEFTFEKDAGNVAGAIAREGIRYPVVQDNDLATWRAWGNEYWPAEYLIDARGHVRESHFGEGSYGQTERDIRALLAEAGHARVGAMARVGPVLRPSAVATPETYLGTMRAQGFPPGGRPSDGTRAYPAAPPNLPVNDFWLSGTWRVTPEAAMARHGARIDAEVVARHVYLVLSGRGTVRVSLDGRPRAPVRVDGQRLYELVRPPDLQPHRLTLRLDPGLAGFAFTFG